MPRKQTTKENTVSTQTQETPDFDVDVDAPEVTQNAEDTVDVPAETAEKAKAEKKKESTRPPVPEGKVSPVAFAKILSEHLRKPHDTLGTRLEEGKSVAPQVVYSYIKNNGADSKNPFPTEKAEGRAAVVDAEAGLKWWDEKDLRVKASKDGKAQKAAEKAAKTTETPATEAAAPVEVTEAE
jgi:hypothetical protein